MFRSKNKRATSKGRRIYYVFSDESGTTDMSKDDSPFFLGGLVTDDPEALARLAMSYPVYADDSKSVRLEPGHGEMKNSRIDDATRRAVLSSLEELGVDRYAVIIIKDGRIQNPDIYEEGSDLYATAFKEMVNLISKYGKDGVYRFRIDDSDQYDQEHFDSIVRERFRNTDKSLAYRNGIRPVDSDLTPAVQIADVFVGSSRHTIRKGENLPDGIYEIRRITNPEARRIRK